MNWAWLRHCSWLDTRARFVAGVPSHGALLDLGSSDGETLRHFHELRPDLRLHAVDLGGQPEAYPRGCEFFRANLETDRLPWADGSMDAITCMHLIEHLRELGLLLTEVSRVLKPGGKAYFETPHLKTANLPSAKGVFTLNFYDDPTHVEPVDLAVFAEQARVSGLKSVANGVSRNWLFAASYPFFVLGRSSRKKFTARVHWIGWSAFLVAQKAG